MTTSTQILSGDRVPLGSPALIPMILGPAPLATVGTTYVFDPGANVAQSIGAGMVADGILYLLRQTSSRVLFTASTGIWQTAPTLTHTGTGTALISLSLSAGNALGCYDDHAYAFVITQGGTALTGARVTIAYDGTTIAENIPVPPENPAVVRSTVDLNAQSYSWSALNGTTILFTAPASKTLTFASAPTSAQNVIDSLNTLALAAPLAVTFRLAQGTGAQLGQAFVEMLSTATGTTAAITIGSGTALSILGLTAATTNGTAATYPLANTGLTATFPATSAYILNDTFVGPSVGPRSSISAIHAAALAAWNQRQINPFGYMVVPQPADTAPNCAAIIVDLESLRATWQSDPTAPANEYAIVGSPWHTTSATQATNETNVATADSALLTAFSTAAASLNAVAVDDVYIPGALRTGIFRRSAAWAAAAKRAGAGVAQPYLAADFADGSIPEVTLIAADGLTRARNENTSTNKLGGLQGPGFAVCRTMADGKSVKFVPGATRAGPASRLANIGDVAVANEIARLVQFVTEPWDGNRPPVDATPGASTFGFLTAAEKQNRADQIDAVVRPILTPDAGKWNCSSFTITVSDPVSGRFIDNGKTPVKVGFVPLGEIQSVDITVAATGTTITSS